MIIGVDDSNGQIYEGTGGDMYSVFTGRAGYNFILYEQ